MAGDLTEYVQYYVAEFGLDEGEGAPKGPSFPCPNVFLPEPVN